MAKYRLEEGKEREEEEANEAKERRRETAGIIGQWVSAVIGGAGIGIVVVAGAVIGLVFGLVLITVGFVLFVISTKIRHLRSDTKDTNE